MTSSTGRSPGALGRSFPSGCSPIGLKKPFPTLFDETAQLFETIGISGGRRGLSLDVNPLALAELLGAEFVDIAR